MPPRAVPPTWRLVERLTPTGLPCAGCGPVHRDLMRMTASGECLPVRFPSGFPIPFNVGLEVELHLAGPADQTSVHSERSRYREVAERVRLTSIRCEGCGERFEELEAYRVHPCAVHDR